MLRCTRHDKVNLSSCGLFVILSASEGSRPPPCERCFFALSLTILYTRSTHSIPTINAQPFY
jgi:hypothetical protein